MLIQKDKTKNRGLTLIELMITLSIFSILLGYATPAMHDLFVKKRLQSAATKIYTDLRFAQSEAIKLNTPIFVSFSHTKDQWCYGLNLREPCDCNQAQSCKLAENEHTVNQSMFRNISIIKSKFAGNKQHTAFDPLKGFASAGGSKNGTIWLASATRDLVAIVVSRLGRVRICSPTISGYTKQCPKAPSL